ncbi:TIGR00730 family Rossman fold protein [Providencia heimbachae]|uniref:LOG family protein n=1 Tax=Providencia heimbachae TaxID=333962 RepID=UPI0010BECBCA|nr:TIGR00730 family Rossman fold protein [Providencia heimbachae]QCJ71008.1 TIGR00730 family Rossman fold protein [Providencia heimbachae]
MRKIKSIAIYCGSSMGSNTLYKQQAIEFAKEMVKRDITLVYGGASVGIMGTIADTVLSLGGKAIGVIPSLLEEREISHKNLTELYKVETMHQRKNKMIELADAFVALPGGYGTLEEYAEVFTWSQIGLHTKPCALFNINNYWQPLIDMTNKMADEGFLHEKYRNMAIVETTPSALLDRFETYIAPPVKTYD